MYQSVLCQVNDITSGGSLSGIIYLCRDGIIIIAIHTTNDLSLIFSFKKGGGEYT